MLSRRTVYALLWVGLAFFYIYCRSYLPLMVMTLTAVMTAVSVMAAFLSSRKVTASLSGSSSSADPGTRELEYCCIVKNDSVFPAPIVTFFVNVRDMSESGVFVRRIKMSAEGKAVRRVYVSLCAPYAAYCEGTIVKPRVFDAFGLVGFRIKTEGDTVRCLMLPNARPQRQSGDIPKTKAEESDRYFDDRRGDDRSQVFDIREYREGDDIRSVHWGISTKHDKLFVKEYSMPMSSELNVLLESPPYGGAEAVKQSADRILGEFVSLANDLIKNEIPFSVFILTENGELARVEASRAEDTAQAMMMYLSSPLPAKPFSALDAWNNSVGYEKTVYYIYDSMADSCGDIPSLPPEMIVIDAAGSGEAENAD